MLAGSGALIAAPPGVLEGQLTIIALKEAAGAELADSDLPSRANAYSQYPLVVLSQDGHAEVARVTAGGDGRYRIVLPPGAYVLDVKDRVQKKLRAEAQSFKIESNQTVEVNMLISK